MVDGASDAPDETAACAVRPGGSLELDPQRIVCHLLLEACSGFVCQSSLQGKRIES